MSDLRAKSLDKANWSDVAFVKALLGDDSIVSVDVQPWTGGGGLSGDSNVVTITRGEDKPESKYFMKLTTEHGIEMSKAVGLAREGKFLDDASRNHPEIASVFPPVLYAHGDMEGARKVLVMECVAGVQAGYFYGTTSLHNWGKDLAKLTEDFGTVDERTVTLSCFRVAADLHGPWWGRPYESGLPELRCRDWYKGEGEASWHGVLEQGAKGWTTLKGTADVKIDERLAAVMDASYAKSTWESFQASTKDLPRTLVHGDFHPSNIVLRKPDAPFTKSPGVEDINVLLVDWEVVGVGSGPQDLGQFMISHSSPEQRRATVDEALASYQDRLATKHGVQVSMEHIKQEYVVGGLGRWVWLLGVIGGLSLPAPALQFFCNQVHAFIVDHDVTADNAPVIRA